MKQDYKNITTICEKENEELSNELSSALEKLEFFFSITRIDNSENGTLKKLLVDKESFVRQSV